MDQRRDLRASDGDREEAALRLRIAHDEGRLSLLEYDSRLAKMYQATTYGDIADLFTDLPPIDTSARPVVAQQAPVASRTRSTEVVRPAGRLPTWVRIVWAAWGTVLAINLTVWLLVDVTSGFDAYFWPIWLLIPTIAIGGATLPFRSARRS
jgi:hypothetical protein